MGERRAGEQGTCTEALLPQNAVLCCHMKLSSGFEGRHCRATPCFRQRAVTKQLYHVRLRLVDRPQFLDEFGGTAAPQASGGELASVNVGIYPTHREGFEIGDVLRLFRVCRLERLAGKEPAPLQGRSEDDLDHRQPLTDRISAMYHGW